MSTTYNPYETPKSELTETQSELEEYELATIWERLLARVIDWLILGFTSIVVVVVVVVIAFLFGAFNEERVESMIDWATSLGLDEDISLLSLNLFNPLIYIGILLNQGLFLALQGVLLHRYGQTIGKRFLRIAIVDADTYEKVPLPRLFALRYLIWDFPALFIGVVNWIIRIVDLCFGLREYRRTLHDMTANTIVIKA